MRYRSVAPTFLTTAMHRCGALPSDNRITTVTRFSESRGGSTGRKAQLDVEYLKPGPPTELFVKFSRDFDDPRRDRGRSQMDLEVRFGAGATLPNCSTVSGG